MSRPPNRRRAPAALLCWGLACCVTAGCAASAPTRRAAALDSVVSRAATEGFAGVVLAGDVQAVLYERAVGLADQRGHRAHEVSEVWPWASVTKQVTALLVLQEVAAGRLTLETTLAQALPAFTGATAAQITVRALLQHTSGLPNPDDTPKDENGVPAFYSPARPRSDWTYCSGPPKAAPGVGFSYDNCDYLVLGALLEHLSGKSFAQLVEERIAEPLRLSPLLALPVGSRLFDYQASGAPAPAQDRAAYGAAGALCGTPRDLLGFDRALLTRALLSEQWTQVMWTGDPKLGYAALGAWSFPARLAGCEQDVQLIERRGNIGGFQVRNVLAPALGQALIVFTNTEAAEFGEVWQRSGLLYDLLSAALCGGP